MSVSQARCRSSVHVAVEWAVGVAVSQFTVTLQYITLAFIVLGGTRRRSVFLRFACTDGSGARTAA